MDVLWIYNTDPRGRKLAFQVAKPIQHASPGLRRGVHYTPFVIPHGGKIDACKQLNGASQETARVYLMQSPDVLSLVKQGALRVGDEAPKVVAPVVREVFPDDVVDAAIKSGERMTGDLAVAATEKLNEMTAAIMQAVVAAPPVVNLPEPEPAAEPALVPTPVTAEVPAPVDLSVAPTDGDVRFDLPSVEWPIERLVDYARARGIEGAGRSKSWILRKIRGG